MAINPWVRLPSDWIMKGGLTKMKWRSGGEGSDNTAALMALTAIAHVADDDSGVARATYDQLCDVTGLSRAKLSNGLEILNRLEVLERGPEAARSTYRLTGYDRESGWAKFPPKSMYSGGIIDAFDDFRLRRPVELNALKLFFLFVARRDRKTNLANIGYEKMEQQTAIVRGRMKAAISFLASLPLVYVEQLPSTNPQGFSNAYRIVGVEPYRHMGTKGRAMEEFDTVSVGQG